MCCPWPVRSRTRRAARIEERANIPAVRSTIATPTLTGGHRLARDAHDAADALHDIVVARESGVRVRCARSPRWSNRRERGFRRESSS